jgi:nucleotide-binding universal stress UspA family protein
MNDLDEHRTQTDSRRRATEFGRATRYGEVVNRYLGTVGYRPDDPVRRVPAPADRAAPTATGLVLVGVDESPISYTAADHAAIEAELHGWDLRILHVRPSAGPRPPSRETADRLLERLTDRVHACSPSVAVTSRIETGSATHRLLSRGRESSLVVVGHRHGIAGIAFGLSVGDRVAARHTGPVLVVRVPGWPPGPQFGQRPIVVGADRPGLTTPAAGFALAEARARGCELVVLHADDRATPSARAETVGGVLVHHRTVAADPATALLDISSRAATVVLGRRGATGSPVALLGSVSRTMLQRACCPVFLVG